MPQDSAGSPPWNFGPDWQNLDPEHWEKFRRDGHHRTTEADMDIFIDALQVSTLPVIRHDRSARSADGTRKVG